MNFDANRLSRLAGLGEQETVGTLNESAAVEECCGCGDESHNHGALEEDKDTSANEGTTRFVGSQEEADRLNQEAAAEREAERVAASKETQKELDANFAKKTAATISLPKADPMILPIDTSDDAAKADAKEDSGVKDDTATTDIKKNESVPLSMDTLRETILELRDEIVAEQQAANKQALTEAPVRAAIRDEIKQLLAELGPDAATNWIYGKQAKPSSAQNKSRATALMGVGFKNSRN